MQYFIAIFAIIDTITGDNFFEKRIICYKVILSSFHSCSNCDRLDVLVGKVPAIGGRRENWKTKVDQMKADVRSLQSDYSAFQGILLINIGL